jgi:hypothetical protein
VTGYELIHGLTPANYSMKGSPGGLIRIDKLFHSNGYTITFSNAPVVFGAFPSLHSACATMEALFISHFFPQARPFVWTYAGILYWATMYLTHHYLVDVVAGACLAVAFFYFFMPSELKDLSIRRSKYQVYDLETPLGHHSSFDVDTDLSSDDNEGQDIIYRSPKPPKSAVPFLQNAPLANGVRGHKHTASIASLIRPGDKEDDWSPVGSRELGNNKLPDGI